MCADKLAKRTVPFLLVCLVAWSALAIAEDAPEIPTGAEIHVRMIDSLNSATAHLGDIFHGTLEEPIFANGKQLYPKGADVTGTVVAVRPSGRLSDSGELNLVVNAIISRGVATSVNVKPLEVRGQPHGKSNATKIGGGAAVGAIIGAIAGGGKGAAIGAGVGGAAGTGAAAATGKKEATVDSEAVLTFLTSSTPTVIPTPQAENESQEKSEPPADQKTGNPPAERPSSAPGSAAVKTDDDSFDKALLFTARDRRVIRNCVSQAAELPPGTVQREELPSGSERQLRVGATLPPDLEKKAEPLPLSCENELPRLPNDQERVIYSGRVLLLDDSGRILDMFDLSGSR